MKYRIECFTKKIFLVSTACLTTASTFCQVDSASNSLLELIKLEASYSAADSLSFNVTFFSTAKDSTGTYVTDSMPGSYKISGNNLWSMVDSVEQVQNEQYAVIIYTQDSTLFITKPDFATKALFSKNFLDSTFLQEEVSGMAISNYGGKQKKLSMSFNPESVFLSYDVYYDSTTYLLNKLEYKLKEGSDYLKIALVFSNYQTSPIDRETFSTTKYFSEQGDNYILSPAYTSYQVISSLQKVHYDHPL